jgi:hypothetical protein
MYRCYCLLKISQKDVLSLDVLSPRTFCLPDVLSCRRFCPHGHFVPTDILPHGRYISGCLCRRMFLSPDVLSLRMLCLRTFCLGTYITPCLQQDQCSNPNLRFTYSLLIPHGLCHMCADISLTHQQHCRQANDNFITQTFYELTRHFVKLFISQTCHLE